MPLGRVERERAHFNEGLQRSGYRNVLGHADYYYYRQRRRQISAEALRCGDGKVMLEVGATGWAGLADSGIQPRELHCINVSETELERGKALAPNNANRPCFHIMDAHHLQFPHHHFDVVFGYASFITSSSCVRSTRFAVSSSWGAGYISTSLWASIPLPKSCAG
jgi:Methyltransferase domain